jgi:hypothetical protein
VDSATRRALVKAFDEAALYGDDARSALFKSPHGATHPFHTPHA